MGFHDTHKGADMVAHNWAHSLAVKFKKDHTAGSLFFEGNTIYSYGYHFPIGIIDTRNVARVVLFTTRSYSNTTSKHIACVRSACSHMDKVYCYDPKAAFRGNHDENIQNFESVCKGIAARLSRANKPSIYLDQIAEQRDMLNKYVTYFNIDIKSLGLSYVFIESKDMSIEATEKARIIREEKERKATEERAKRAAKDMRNFRAFKLQSVYTIDGAILRYNKDTQRIETSKGIEIPVKIAERAFKWIIKTLKSGGCEGECKYKILDFEVTALNSKLLIVGCHTIELKEVNKLAKKLGW